MTVNAVSVFVGLFVPLTVNAVSVLVCLFVPYSQLILSGRISKGRQSFQNLS